MGDTWFVEQFGRLVDDSNPTDDTSWCKGFDGNMDGQGFDCVPSNDENDLETCQHQQCTFIHPATYHNYQYYNSGWWGLGSYDSSNGPAMGAETWLNQFPALATANSCDDGDVGQCNSWNAFMFMYAWTCHYDSDGDKNLDWFTGNPNRNCYADNEPWYIDTHGKPDAEPPKNMQAYVVRYFDDDTIGLSNVDFDGNHGDEFYLEECGSGGTPFAW